MRFLTSLVLPAALLLSACGAATAPAADTAAPAAETAAEEAAISVNVRDAFIVQPPEGRDVTGGGLYVSVTGGPVTLIGASTPAASNVEMHTMSMENDMMQMRKVESFRSPRAPLWCLNGAAII